jgi:hypothetical protein
VAGAGASILSAVEAGGALGIVAETFAFNSFLHSDRNFLRSLPWRPFASTCFEHSIDSGESDRGQVGLAPATLVTIVPIIAIPPGMSFIVVAIEPTMLPPPVAIVVIAVMSPPPMIIVMTPNVAIVVGLLNETAGRS